MVGTFYRAPSPEEKPYVEVGSKVKKGDVIGKVYYYSSNNLILSEKITSPVTVKQTKENKYSKIFELLGYMLCNI